MSDFQMFHALGQTGNEQEGSVNPGSSKQPAAPQFRPPIASSHDGYQQTSSAYNANVPTHQYGAAQPAQQAYGNHSYPQGHAAPQYGVHQDTLGGGGYTGELATQMGGLGLGGETSGSGPVRPHRKKQHRHAFHTLETPETSAGAFNGLPGQSQQQIPGGQ